MRNPPLSKRLKTKENAEKKLNLREWAYMSKVPIIELCRQLEVSRNYIFMLMRGRRKPSARLMNNIKTITSGVVSSIDDLRDYDILDAEKGEAGESGGIGDNHPL